MKLNDVERRAIVDYRLEKAQLALEQVDVNAKAGYWDLVANRLYYAAYHALSALLIANEYEAHTHAGVFTLFGQHFVKKGLFSLEENRLYHHLYQQRQTGDYGDIYFLTKDEVAPNIEPTRAFVEKICSMI